ncbi:MAG: hypothetical protein WC455_09910 [Dehalococcoidia bacterium]
MEDYSYVIRNGSPCIKPLEWPWPKPWNRPSVKTTPGKDSHGKE